MHHSTIRTWTKFGLGYLPDVNVPATGLKLLGWREWLSIPDLGIERIKAKIDTGARSSCLHTCGHEIYNTAQAEERVRFTVHPLRKRDSFTVDCDLPLTARRRVRDSGGHEEWRPFVRVPVQLGPEVWEVEFSLTRRDNMRFRMLLGRTAIRGRFLVDPALSYQIGKPRRRVPARD